MTIFGPVLPYDLIRQARRGRFYVLRTLYGLILLGILYAVFTNTISRIDGRAHPNDLARFAEGFFYAFMLLQYFAVLVLTPAYVGGAVAEEKDRRTMDYLLTTRLTSHEIILAKLAARCLLLLLALLTGLPVLSLTQLFGGVSPELLWAGFAATLLTLLSVGGISIWMSVQCRRPRDAIVLAFLVIVVYFLFWPLVVVSSEWVARDVQGTGVGDGVLAAVQAVQYWYQAGILFVGYDQMDQALRAGTPLADACWGPLRDYAIFHGLVCAVTVTWSVLRLRRVTVRQAHGVTRAARRWRRLPRVGADPMLWKELRLEGGFRLGWLGWLLAGLVAVACLAPGLFILGQFFYLCMIQQLPNSSELGWGMNIWVRSVTAVLGALLPLAVVVRAAGSLGSERDRQTLESLLASPLTVREILVAKWWGSMAGPRFLLYLLAAVWLLGVVSTGLHLLAVPVLLLLLAVHLSYVAALGLAFAVSPRPTVQSILAAVGVAFLTGGGHLLCCSLGWMVFSGASNDGAQIVLATSLGLSPPVILTFAAFRGEELSNLGREGAQLIVGFLIATGIYVAATVVLWQAALMGFIRSCGRIDGRGEAGPPA